MALLDMQGMDAEREETDKMDCGVGSHLSLLLCDSVASLALCL
jgi:hypothetical protein